MAVAVNSYIIVQYNVQNPVAVYPLAALFLLPWRRGTCDKWAQGRPSVIILLPSIVTAESMAGPVRISAIISGVSSEAVALSCVSTKRSGFATITLVQWLNSERTQFKSYQCY